MSPDLDGVDELARSLGKVPSGIFIVTVRAGGEATAFLASWVQQCAFQPPSLTVAVKNGRPAQALLDAGAAFAVNVVPAGATHFLRHFGRGFAPGENPYSGIATEMGTTGVELLAGSLASLECAVRSSVPAGDHTLYVGEILAGRCREPGEPMVHVRRNGLGY